MRREAAGFEQEVGALGDALTLRQAQGEEFLMLSLSKHEGVSERAESE
jgi:hypothetical protein